MRAASSAFRPLRWGVPFLLAVAASAAGCRQKPAPPAPSASAPPAASSSARASAPPRRPRQPLNLLLITVDGLRADMPWAGYPRDIAPHLTELAKHCAIYDRAYSVASMTSQSVATFLSGQFAASLYRTGEFFASYPDSNLMIAELMRARGIRTLGWHGNMYFAWGKYEQGFDVWRLLKGISFNPQTDFDVTGDRQTDLGIEILGNPENTGKQFFAFSHYMDPHAQFVPHPDGPSFGPLPRDLYDAEVHFTDRHLHRLFEWARQQPWWERTALIISADHGEGFGEHRLFRHAYRLYEELVRVPWFICGPGVVPRRVAERRSHIDLAPTILDLMGLPPKEGAPGKSLVPELYGAPPENREPILLELAEDTKNDSVRVLIEGDYKLIDTARGKRRELFDLAKDPGEQRDLSAEQPARMQKLLAKLEAEFAKIPNVVPHGGYVLKSGAPANGPSGPAKPAPSAAGAPATTSGRSAVAAP